jgi:hypothetical protein
MSSMSSMHGALPNLNPGTGNPNAFLRANSRDSSGAQWAPQPYQPSYPQASHPSTACKFGILIFWSLRLSMHSAFL